MIKFYCEHCEKFQPVETEPVQRDDLNPVPWGDILCSVCHLVIATMTADEPGTYGIVRVPSMRNVGAPGLVLPLEQLPRWTQAKIQELRNKAVRLEVRIDGQKPSQG